MNFLSGRSGFYEEAATGTRGTSSSSSSSSSSSFHHRALPPFTYEAYGGPTPPLPPNNNFISGSGGGGGEDTPDDADDPLQILRRGGEGSISAATIQREHMFDKVVTPSDVGKLNRLVIPKQHAEKYFPLDSSTNGKGLLLNFEDRNGKPWRFRYSYWNSSQSYVMTKGWSRFVKEKKLDAGDIVSFQRGGGQSGQDRLFIDWRRRPDAPELQPPISFQRSVHPWTPFFMPTPPRDYPHFLQSSSITPPGYSPYPYCSYSGIVNGNPCPPGSVLYVRPSVGPLAAQARRGGEGMVFSSVPVVQGKAAAKRLRLFGVNMECPISESDECDILAHPPTLPLPPFDSSSSLQLTPSANQFQDKDDKGKGSMSLDLDI